jgi:NSS family neurotransmitter:Na+ symporter
VGQPDLQVMGRSLMDFCDFLTAQIMLPVGAFLTSVLVGWCTSKALVREEFTNFETSSVKSLFGLYLFCVRFIVPVSIFLILMHQFGVI